MRIRHKGLHALAEHERASTTDLVPKLRRILTLLDEARHPGLLQARLRLSAGTWRVRVSGNCRVRFEDNEAVDAH